MFLHSDNLKSIVKFRKILSKKGAVIEVQYLLKTIKETFDNIYHDIIITGLLLRYYIFLEIVRLLFSKQRK